MGKKSRERRARMQQVLDARAKEGLVRHAALYDWWVQWCIRAGALRDLPDYQPIVIKIDHNDVDEAIELNDQLNVCPPYEMIWIESGNDQWQSGVLVQPYDADKHGYVGGDEMFDEENEDNETPAKSYAVSPYLIYRNESEVSTLPRHRLTLYNDKGWDIEEIEMDAGYWDSLFRDDGGKHDEAQQMLVYDIAIDSVHTALKVFTLLNIRNIVLVDNPPAPDFALEFKRHFNREPVTSHTLGVKPEGKTNVNRSEPKPYQGIVALHLRRGHFKTFRKPRFGRAGEVGQFWYQPTAVGNPRKGIVAKDYEVKPE